MRSTAANPFCYRRNRKLHSLYAFAYAHGLGSSRVFFEDCSRGAGSPTRRVGSLLRRHFLKWDLLIGSRIIYTPGCKFMNRLFSLDQYVTVTIWLVFTILKYTPGCAHCFHWLEHIVFIGLRWTLAIWLWWLLSWRHRRIGASLRA